MKITNEESLNLSEEILTDMELGRIPLSNICMKTKRLTRLLGDTQYEKIFYYEMFGYKENPDGIPLDVFKMAKIAERVSINEQGKEVAYQRSIEQIISEINFNEARLKVSFDPNVSISSANPNQSVYSRNNAHERERIYSFLVTLQGQLSERTAFIYRYVLNKNAELKLQNILEKSFDKLVKDIVEKIVKYLPDGAEKINSSVDNLKSDNVEDWSNAVTTFRRILSDLAKSIKPKNNGKYYDILKSLAKENYKDMAQIHHEAYCG